MIAQPSSPAIVFLDIDGVLLPRKAWALPANVAHMQALEADPKHSVGKAALGTAFDPSAVALVNRLCSTTGARLVVHSNWRRNVGLAETRAKLIAEGIDGSLFHEDWACGFRRTSEKHHEIGWWLDDHRTNPCGDPPEWTQYETEADRIAGEAAQEEWSKRHADYGIRFVILEDECLGHFEDRRIATDFGEGLLLADYRKACGALGGVDRVMGVHPVAQEDLDRVLEAFDGDDVRAAEWLHASQRRSRAIRLDAELARKDNDAMRMFGYGSPGDAGEQSRGAVFAELDQVLRERQEAARLRAAEPLVEDDF